MGTNSDELTELLQYLEPESSRLALKGNDPPKCQRLREMRTELGLTLASVCNLYGLIQSLAVLGTLKIDGETGHALIEFPSKEITLESLRAINLQDFLGQMDSLDITHLSKFERGDQVPWIRARARLTLLFSLIYGKPLQVKDVFPELEKFPGIKSTVKADHLLDV